MAAGLRVVATNNVEVFRHLAAVPLARLGITCQVVADRSELMAALHVAPTAVALVDVDLAGGSGYDACRTIKDDPTLAGTRVALVLPPGGVDRDVIDRLAASGCDDVIMPPLAHDDFYAHLAQLTNLPLRRDRRIAVELDIELPGGETTLTGHVTNVGAGGLGLRLAVPLAAATRLAVRLTVGDQHSPATAATVAWCRPADPTEGDPDQPAFTAGLAWDGEVPLRTRLLLEQVALFDVVNEPEGDGALTVLLHGDFTEMTHFDALASRLSGVRDVVFDLAAVRYISSAGVRAWCELLATLDGARKRYRHCSIAFASQAAMVPLVLADGEVLSLEAPYYCDACGRDEIRLLEIGLIARDDDRMLPPHLTCGACGGATELDDLPERYFAFLAG
jgi:CheY-like chemotaxis protein